ncbi:MAG: MarR family transcriptional regulator [Candidatus Hydrothermarchaeaceae archaeon]
MSGDAEHNIGDLTADQSFVLRILSHGAIDVETLATATFSTKHRMQSIIEELRGRGLVEKQVEGKRVLFKRKNHEG